MTGEEQEQEVGSEEEVCEIRPELVGRLLAAHQRRKSRANDLVSAKDLAKEAKERLDGAQSLVNDLLDEAKRGPQPEQTELFEEATPEDFGFEEATPEGIAQAVGEVLPEEPE